MRGFSGSNRRIALIQLSLLTGSTLSVSTVPAPLFGLNTRCQQGHPDPSDHHPSIERHGT